MKKTICFSNPAFLRVRLAQLEVEQPETKDLGAPKSTIPVEDIGVVILEHPQITISHHALSSLLENNVAVITCNGKHLPTGLLLPLDGHSLQTRRYRDQLEASAPLKKQLWQQTVRQKIVNQAIALQRQGLEAANLMRWSNEVRSGDPDNFEARAAAWYWPRLFSRTSLFQGYQPEHDFSSEDFLRERYGDWPNCLLNYGYAILRAVVARALVGSGLLPALGIHHRNQYNAYCLADDIMEPYRPFVDVLVCQMLQDNPHPPHPNKDGDVLTPGLKRQLLVIPVMDVNMEGKQSPLQIAAQRTTNALVGCFAGTQRQILYPTLA